MAKQRWCDGVLVGGGNEIDDEEYWLLQNVRKREVRGCNWEEGKIKTEFFVFLIF